MQPPPQIQPPNVSGYANTPYSRSSHSWHDGCLPEHFLLNCLLSVCLYSFLLNHGGSVSYIGKSAGSHASAEESVRTAVRTRRRLIQRFKNLGLSRSFARGP